MQYVSLRLDECNHAHRKRGNRADLMFDPMDFAVVSPNGIGSRFPNPLVAMADGSVFHLKRDISAAILRQRIDINDGGRFSKSDREWIAP